MSDSPAGARPQGSARLARATNVAPTSGRLVGRGSALEDLASRFEQGARIVTLHGAGGIGKTSLALAHSRAHGEKGEGAWFCDLGEARSPDAICAALARTLGIPLSGKLQDENVLQLGHAIAARGRALVVLDNFEQVVRHA
ncbi:AAA family ATPase [bacterium]|nr:AAA family ATPase [bacterium]